MEGQHSPGNRPRIVVLGSGNVASHLAPALDNVGNVVQVWSRNHSHAAGLSARLKSAVPVSDPLDIDPLADFYIVAVSDDAVPAVAAMLAEARIDGIVAHTSGSVRLDVVKAILGPDSRVGVFYPLQTFSKSVELNIAEVPFFIEGDTPATAEALLALARTISYNVRIADSAVRGHLHVAAVFANNFANYVWDVADSYLKRNVDMDLTIFKPLLEETLRKAMINGPRESQTGPARRGDENVMKAHLQKLTDDEARVYALLSDEIRKLHTNNP